MRCWFLEAPPHACRRLEDTPLGPPEEAKPPSKLSCLLGPRIINMHKTGGLVIYLQVLQRHLSRQRRSGKRPDTLSGSSATLSHWLVRPRETSGEDTTVSWSGGELTCRDGGGRGAGFLPQPCLHPAAGAVLYRVGLWESPFK